MPDHIRHIIIGKYVKIDIFHLLWPWEIKSFNPTPTNRRKELVKAGALILAEIERLDRYSNKNSKKKIRKKK